MSRKRIEDAPPTEVARVLRLLEPHAVSEECLYLRYSRLDQWKLADLAKFFREDDYWRLFRRVCRHWAVGRRSPTLARPR